MKGKAKDLLSDYFLDGWNIDPKYEFEITYVDAKQFLRPERMDLICKLVYIDSKIKNRNLDYARELYTEHIRAFSNGAFQEPGNKNKNSIEKYFEVFDSLIESCQKSPLTAEKSVVPVGADGNILDGSHRTAVAIYFNLLLPIIKIPNKINNYDYNYFKCRGMKEEYLDYIAYNYLLWKDNVYIACIWPAADEPDKKIISEKYISETADIFYKKEICLNYHGLHQLMVHTYGNQEWAGNALNGFSGISNKVNECYKERKNTTIYVLSGSDLKSLVNLKTKIRDLFKISNHSIHITDTKEEAVYLGQVALNKNSIDLMNYGNPFVFTEFIKKLLIFKKEVNKVGYSFDDFIIDSGSILSLYGLRDTNDIDYFTLIDEKLPKSDIYANHLEYNIDKYYSRNLDSLIYNPDSYMYFLGVKFVSFDCTAEMKRNRNEPKDIEDLKLMKNCVHGKNIFNYFEYLKHPKKYARNLKKKSSLFNKIYSYCGYVKGKIKNIKR